MKHFAAAAIAALLLAGSTIPSAAQTCPDGLPRTLGYWKTHPEAWPLSTVQIGDDEVGMADAINEILKQPVRGSGEMILLHQLIPAMLNIAAGVDDAAVASYIEEAHDLLTSDGDRQDMIDIAARLDEFNNGAFCSLPVELTTFDAQADGSIVTLRWETASEDNNAGFDVEHRRGNGYGFDTLDFVSGNGSTITQNSYSLTFENLGFGKHTFRLRQVDLDGTFSYSPEVEIAVELTEGFAITEAYPNPFNPTTNIRFSLRESGEIHLAVFDLLGRRVKTLAAGEFSAGSHDVTFSAENLPSGTYVYKLQTESGHVTGTMLLLK